MDDVIQRLRRIDPVPAPVAPPPIEALLGRLEKPRESRLDVSSTGEIAGRRWGRASQVRAASAQLPLLLAIGASIAIAAVALLVLRHKPAPVRSSSGPPAASGPPRFPRLSGLQRKQINYVMKADGAVSRRDRVCGLTERGLGHPPSSAPSLSQGSPSASMLAIIGPLRRAQTSADRLPARKIWHGPHSKPRTYPYGAYPAVAGIYARYIRYARHRDGANYYLVPAQNVNWQVPVPARCYHEQVTALRQQLHQIPHPLRAGIFALQATYLTFERRTADPYPGLCLSSLNDTGNGDGGSCYALSQIESGHTLSSGASGGVPVVYGLAPDGVRSVTFYYRGRYPGHPLTALVINNVFILHDPQDRLPGNGFPTKLIWRSANGHVIKTIRWS